MGSGSLLLVNGSHRSKVEKYKGKKVGRLHLSLNQVVMLSFPVRVLCNSASVLASLERAG